MKISRDPQRERKRKVHFSIQYLGKLSLASLNFISFTTSFVLGFYFLDRWLIPNQIWVNDLIGHVLPWLFLPLVILVPVAIIQKNGRLGAAVAIQRLFFLAL
jgi:hypothetical protein